MTFSELGLIPALLRAVEAQGYETPSPIQQQAIPAILQGDDIMAAAQTGTGKTAGFTLPLLQRLADKGQRPAPKHVRALVLTPTRELAAQVADNVKRYGTHLPLKSAVIFGGVGAQPQIDKLKKGVDILVATPGRLLDLYQQGAVTFKQLEYLVLDEADRMLDMGFIHDIRRILKLLPDNRQNLLFSATFSDSIKSLAKGWMKSPKEISVTPPNSTAQRVEQSVYPVDKNRKSALLTHLIKHHAWSQVLVFSRTKHGANRLAKQLDSRGIAASAIHGNKSQGARTKALAEFKSGDIQVLVATDIAARGLDIDQLPVVINVDLPNVAEDYVHRIGRTGRAGATGIAISLVCADEAKLLHDIEKLIGLRLERHTVPDFEPEHPLPSIQPHPRKNHPGGKGNNKPKTVKTGTESDKPRRRRRRRKPAQASTQ